MSWQINVEPKASLKGAEVEAYDPDAEPTKAQVKVARAAASKLRKVVDGPVEIQLRGLATGRDGSEEGNAPDAIHVELKTPTKDERLLGVLQFRVEGNGSEAIEAITKADPDQLAKQIRALQKAVPSLVETVDAEKVEIVLVGADLAEAGLRVSVQGLPEHDPEHD